MHREAETCLQDFYTDISKDIYTKKIIEIYESEQERAEAVSLLPSLEWVYV